MFLSELLLNPGNRQARRDLSSSYELHRTLLRAFPDQDDGGSGRVLFRIEPNQEGRPPKVLVQSAEEPDWSFHANSEYAEVRGPKHVHFVAQNGRNADQRKDAVTVQRGDPFRFRLLANPTVKRNKKRHGLFQEEDQIAWLERKGQLGGFRFDRERLLVVPTGRIRSQKNSGDGKTTTLFHYAVRFDGVLQAEEPQRFVETLESGIGSAKGFGFGLLSLARS